MKKNFLLLLIVFFILSCGVFKKAALKYWTKSQVKEFISNCEANAKKIMTEEKAVSFCDCAANTVAKEYHDYAEMKKLPIKAIFKMAEDCRK